METTRYNHVTMHYRVRQNDPMSIIMASVIGAIGHGLTALLSDDIEITATTEYMVETYALDKQVNFQVEDFTEQLYNGGVSAKCAAIIAPTYQYTGYVGCNVVSRSVCAIKGLPMIFLARDVEELGPRVLANSVEEITKETERLLYEIRKQFCNSSLLPIRAQQVKNYSVCSPHDVGLSFTIDFSRNRMTTSDESSIGSKGSKFDTISLRARCERAHGDYVEPIMESAVFKFMNTYFELITDPALIAADIMGVEITQSSKADGQGV